MRRPLSALSVLSLWSVAWAGPVAAQDASEAGIQTAPPFSGKVLATGLEWPWELTWGPDERLWVTERAGKRVSRIDPETGAKKVALTIGDVLVGGQHEGLLGMALHPELLQGSGNDFVYVAYIYDADPAPGDAQVERRAKVVRFTYDQEGEALGQASEVIAGIPAGTDHNAGRLKFGPDGMLYYGMAIRAATGSATTATRSAPRSCRAQARSAPRTGPATPEKSCVSARTAASLRTTPRSTASRSTSSRTATATRRGSCSGPTARSIRPSTARRPTTRST
jgi:glucose/arabinose dehydrogenase